MKNTIEIWAKSVATIALLILIIQWSWNQFMPLFGIPELNLFSATGLFALVFIGVSIISVAWNYQVRPHEHYYHEIKGQQENSTNASQ